MAFGRDTSEINIIKTIFDIDLLCEIKHNALSPPREKMLKKRLKLVNDLKILLNDKINHILNEITESGYFKSSSYEGNVDLQYFNKYQQSHRFFLLNIFNDILENIEKGDFHPTIGMTDLLIRNLDYKKYLLNNTGITLIDKVRILNRASRYMYIKELSIDSVIFFSLNVVSLIHSEFEKIIDDHNLKNNLYIEISVALESLSDIYSKHGHYFKKDQFKESFSELFIILCDINKYKNYRDHLNVFKDDEQLEKLNKLCDFLKKPKSCQKRGVLIGAGLLSVTALYSLPLAGTLLFGAGVIKTAQKLEEKCCDSKRLRL
jgi:hypothetical protein